MITHGVADCSSKLLRLHLTPKKPEAIVEEQSPHHLESQEDLTADYRPEHSHGPSGTAISRAESTPRHPAVISSYVFADYLHARAAPNSYINLSHFEQS